MPACLVSACCRQDELPLISALPLPTAQEPLGCAQVPAFADWWSQSRRTSWPGMEHRKCSTVQTRQMGNQSSQIIPLFTTQARFAPQDQTYTQEFFLKKKKNSNCWTESDTTWKISPVLTVLNLNGVNEHFNARIVWLTSDGCRPEALPGP